ncbi:MAG: hypothetical protein AABZ74_10055 [Cyanobacteriota bacterium]
MRQFKLFFLITFLSLLSSCACGFKFTKIKEPIYATKSDFIGKIKTIKPTEINNTGKIYLYKNFIFVHEKNNGIHIIDNIDIKNPKNIGFLRIPMSGDIAIKDNILYADMFKDLIAIDINDITNSKFLRKNDNVFEISNGNNEEKIQIGYRVKETIYEPVVCGTGNSNSFILLPMQPPNEPITPSSSSPNQGNTYGKTGIGGSLARFSIIEDYLYVLSSIDMIIYNLKNTQDFQKENTIKIGNGLETIFPYDDKLFLGSQTGMYVYDNKNKIKPEFLSTFQHIKSCDPVVVENKKAYVTLRSGSSCRGGNNELDIIDLEDIKNPKLIKTYPMKNPSGLAIKDNILYLCDGSEGLKIFDVSKSDDIKFIKAIAINNPKDIILNENNHAIIVAEEGLLQYDFSDLKQDNVQLSKITTKNVDKNIEIGNNNNNDSKKVGDIFYYNWYEKYFLE